MKLSEKQREALKIVAAGRFYPTLVHEEDGWFARWRGETSDNGWVDVYVREATVSPLTQDAEDQHHETLHDAWLAALASHSGLVRWDESECRAFSKELQAWGGNAAEDIAARRALVFHLESDKTNVGNFSLVCARPHTRDEYRALGLATFVWRPLTGLKADTQSTLRLALTRAEAEAFIQSGARALHNADYAVSGLPPCADITAHADIASAASSAAQPLASAKADLTLTIRIAGEIVTEEEIRFLLDQGSSLVFFRNRWIEVDRDILRQALRALAHKGPKNVPALGFALGLGHIGRLEISELQAHGWLRGLVNDLYAHGWTGFDLPKPPDGFVGSLRDYQLRGVAWLDFLTSHGFGALLADDMGLGKTIQTLAWLLTTPKPRLVVAPLTLLGNWAHEAARFVPQFKVYVHQGGNRHFGSGFFAAANDADLVLTSYTLLTHDYAAFADVKWSVLVLDEAQAVKNPDTQAAHAIRSLMPPRRVALTGTPVENSVADVWALEDFLNPNLLGTRTEFAERFLKPILRDECCAAGKRLRHALEPFILRRLKTDENIASELGDKRETREYCPLSDAQRRAYEAAWTDFRVRPHKAGDVFALLTELKLICDGVEDTESGKFLHLIELLETIFANGESALVFSQYARVGKFLQENLARHFGRRFPFLHGTLTAAQRETQIRAFTTSRRPDAFILSLKAGGFGINLTKATHVIHFDRWWNPAVENQATDRAYRLGQTKDVFVHLFITSGTLEEHVDELLNRKARVANAVISEAEWLAAAQLDAET